RRQADSFVRESLAVVGSKLPAAIAGRFAAAKIDVRLIPRLAAAIQTIAFLIAHLRWPARRMPLADIARAITGLAHDPRPQRHPRIELQLAECPIAKLSAPDAL